MSEPPASGHPDKRRLPGSGHGTASPDHRPVGRSILRGLRLRCPGCGTGALFHRFLKITPHCDRCAEPLHHHRADDAPAYFTMLIVGHVIVAGVLWAEMKAAWPLWQHVLIWPAAVVILSLLLLPRIKGGIVALQWAMRMHGFARNDTAR